MRQMWQFKLRRTTVLSAGLLAFLLGIGFSRLSGLDTTWIWLLLPFAIVSFRARNIITLLSIIAVGFTLGWWRGSEILVQLEPYARLHQQRVVVKGIAATDGVYGDNSQLEFDMENITIIEPETRDVIGKIKASGFGVPAVNRGDEVQVEGKLYKTRGGRQASISYAELAVTGRADSFVETSRKEFIAGMYSALAEPYASFGLGLLVGQRNTLPGNVSDNLSAAGLTHIVAVSGYNLTIIVRAVQRLFGKRSKYQTFIFSVLLIGVFLLFTGLSPSIVRASIVSGLGLVAWYYGRRIKPVLLILLAAAITAGWYPPYLWSDIGWYLSFLAFFGVLILAPLIVKRMSKRKSPHPLTLVVIESFAAQLLTAPLIVFIFKELSVVALVANLLVVPIVPVAMLFSLVAGIAGIVITPVASWLSWPANIVMTYMLDVVALLARVPNALVNITIDAWHMLLIYSCILFIVLVLWRKTRGRRIIIGEEIQ